MADNVTVTAGSGTTIAADEVTDGTLGSVKVQYVKLMDGTLDGTSKAAVGANGLKVDGSAVTQPVSVASIPSHAVTNAGTFVVQNTAATPAGTNVIGHMINDAGTAIIGKVGIDQTTPGTTNGVQLTAGSALAGLVKVSDGTNSATVKPASTASVSTDSALVVAISPNSLNANGQATMANSAPVAIASNQSSIPVTNTPLTNFGAGDYEKVAASSTAQVLGATGATGDFISGILVIPGTTSPGLVTLLDGATSIPVFVGGSLSLLTLHPFFIPLGLISVSGAWKITTGLDVSCIGIGNFT